MLFEFARIGPQNTYKLMISCVVPRPIAWVVSQDAHGALNAAPFSFFNVMSGEPPIVALGIGTRPSGESKDSSRNILETRQFVVNLVDEAMAERMNVTAIEFDRSVNELAAAGLATAPSALVGPPRIADSPVALECELFQAVPIDATKAVILGRVLACHIRDELVQDAERCHVATPGFHLVGRMHGAGWYTRTRDLFRMDRLTVAEFQSIRGNRAEAEVDSPGAAE